MSETASIGATSAGAARGSSSRFISALFLGHRLRFTLLVSALVSTQVFFQPSLYQPFLPGYIVQSWAVYLGECLLMAFAIMFAATLAEAATAGRSRTMTRTVMTVALFAGALAGAFLLVPYYDLPFDSVFDARFIGDVCYWLLIGGGAMLIYWYRQRAAADAATLRRARADQIVLSKELAQEQLNVVCAQIEPHFLLNTVANVARLARADATGSAMLGELGRYLGKALPLMRRTRTTLGQEISLVQDYLALLQPVLGTRLRYTIEIPADLRELDFPPMMLLTLTENAVKHGVNPSPSGGVIAITAEARDGALRVRVANSGCGTAAATSTGVGLANTRTRLVTLYGKDGILEIQASPTQGVTATIGVPLSEPARM